MKKTDENLLQEEIKKKNENNSVKVLQQKKSRHTVLIDLISWLLRICVGIVFVVSGFVKAVDPWGTFYKFSEYTSALGWSIVPNLILSGVFALCLVEFLIGIFLLFGCYRRFVTILALLFMAIMLPLTLWIAVADPVKDCGCFGDFIILSNWATFWKNVVLIVMICWLAKYNTHIVTIISPAFQWMAVVVSMIYIGAVMGYGYFKQPLMDFRAYPVGSHLVNDVDEKDEEFVFVYEKDGIKKEFGIEDVLPDEEEGWKFVDRRVLSHSSTEDVSDDKTFRIWDETGDNDETENILTDKGKMLLLLVPDLPAVSPATTWKINEIYDWCVKSDIDMLAVVAGSSQEISDWKDMSMPNYDIYTADDTAIKEVARGNPSVLYMEDGIIKWKSTLSSIDVDELTEMNGKSNTSGFSEDGKRIVYNWSLIFIGVLAVLIMFSMLPRLKNIYSFRRTTRDGKAHH